METTKMTMVKICKLINKNGSATVIVQSRSIVIGFDGSGFEGTLIMIAGGRYVITTQDGSKFQIAKGELVTVAL